MKTYHFPAKTDGSGTIILPDDILDAIAPDSEVEIVILVRELHDEDDDEAWGKLAIESFFAGYDDADAIYDEL